MIDSRLVALLACAWEHKHPYYAAAAYTLARQIGDTEAMRWALELGAADWRPEPVIRMRTDDSESRIVQMELML